VKKPVRLAFHCCNDLGMTVTDERHAKAGRQIHISIAIGVAHIRAQGLHPYDRVVASSGLLLAAPATRRERGALTRSQTLDPRAASGRRDRMLDGRKRVSGSHARVLARPCRGER
jgi:GGDEF domain-containing protein